MMRMRTDDFTGFRLNWPPRRFPRTLRNGVFLACACVLVAALVRSALQNIEHVHYMPLLGAVMATTLLANRPATFLAIGLAVVTDLFMTTRSSVMALAADTILFVVVASVMAEVCHRLTSRTALLHSILTSVPVVTLDGEGRILRITAPAAASSVSLPKTRLPAPSASSLPISTRRRSRS